MKLIQAWSNMNLFPTEEEPQRALFFCLPQFYRIGVSAPVNIGISKLNSVIYGQLEFKVIIFGFGIIYNSSWDY